VRLSPVRPSPLEARPARLSPAGPPTAHRTGVGLTARLLPRLTLPSDRNAWLALAALTAIVVAAVLLRFVDLAANPGGLYPDEAAEGLDAARLLHEPGYHPDFLVWFPSDAGREALFGYVVAGAFEVFGHSTLVLRETAAAFGVAGVLAIGRLGRRFGTWVGLAAAAYAAGALWLVCVSRDGYRNTIVPLFGAVALIALLNWSTHPGRRSALIAGAVTSLAALYTYQPLKLLPVLAVVWFLWLRRVDRGHYRQLRADAFAFAAAFLVVAAPMIAVAVTEPANYFGRAFVTSAVNPEVNTDYGLPAHVLRTVLMFGLVGDPSQQHNIASLPLLPLPLTAVAGFGMARLWRLRRDPSHSLILLALPVFLLPPLVAPEGTSPHYLRALGLAAPLGVTIGLGAAELVERARGRRGRPAGRVTTAAVGLTLAAVAVWSGVAYLSRPAALRYKDYSYALVYLAERAADHPGSAVVLDDYPATVVRFIDYDRLPAIFKPGDVISNPGSYSEILATYQMDIESAVGPQLGSRARAVAWDPSGAPTVWALDP
jgi:hypothetical protein